MKAFLFGAALLTGTSLTHAQFDGPAGTVGSLAIHKDSSAIVNWASGCTISRGLEDISLGGTFASHGQDSDATGPATGSTVVSLGDSGVAILTFDTPITNGSGPDFAVFENSFSDVFLELAFVEVSSDGVNFVRFPATSNSPTDVQFGPFSSSGDPTLLNNLAGKYRSSFGTPFDLDELSGEPQLDITAITHVKIIDVIGSIDPQFGSQDQNGNLINDPFPTAFASSGFDLDAVAVLNQQSVSISEISDDLIHVYPNPINAGSELHIVSPVPVQHVRLFNLNGQEFYSGKSLQLETHSLPKGLYFVALETEHSRLIKKVAVR